MSVSDFLAARADDILRQTLDSMAERRLAHYEQLGREESGRRLRAVLDVVIAGASSRDLVPVLAYAEQIGRERYNAGFEIVEVQSVINVLEETLWRTMLAGLPQSEVAEALGVVATILGAAKDKLASTYVSLATGTHVPSLDLQALFRGTQNTGGGAVG